MWEGCAVGVCAEKGCMRGRACRCGRGVNNYSNGRVSYMSEVKCSNDFHGEVSACGLASDNIS